jgi:AsmA protein
LTVSGSSASPVISGPVRINNTQLAGFDLGSKLQTLSQLTGGKLGSATGSGTNIRSLSMNIREAGGGIQTDNIALDVAGLGTATGAGSVSPAGALNYNVVLKLTGLAGGGSASPAAAGGGGAGGLLGGLGGLAGMIPGGGAAAGGLGGLAGGLLKNGIPVAIGGTTSNPTFAPNLAGLASGAGKGLINGATKGQQKGTQSNPLGNALGGFLNRH